MMAGIIALIQALPEIFKLLNRLGDVASRLVALSKQEGFERWISGLESSIDKAEKAKTREEKLDAAQSLVGIIRDIK